MNTKCSHYLLSAGLVSALSAPMVVADDTEIFFNEEVLSNTEAFQPNVLFIFDTSGSMGWNITSKEAYDPSHDYGGATSDTIYVYDLNYNYLNISIDSTRNSCQYMVDKIDSTPTAPIYIGKAAEWNPNNSQPKKSKWRNVKDSNRTVECEEDAGEHGIDNSSTDLYARSGKNGPYTASASNAISWSGINDRMYVSANYHQYQQTAASVTRVKMDVMKEAAIDLVNGFSGLNFGMMRFDGSNGGYVKHHFSDIESDRSNIISNINSLTASGNTPLTETLWEAHKYYQGGSIEYGTNSGRDPLAINGSIYNSPITEEACQKNYVIYLTDGTPYSDSGRDSTIRGLTGSSCAHSDGTTSPNNTCLDELAGYMADKDDNQSVKTYTIGFAIDMPLLEETANKGEGQYYTANTSEELKTAFNKILVSILSKSTTFTAPAVSVNAFNSLQHRDELFYAVFEPSKDPRWHGNLKKYKINHLGTVLDSNGDDAIEESSGYFQEGAKSFWSLTDDGAEVRSGGAASLLENGRTIYTVSGDETADNIPLNSSSNKVAYDNDLITNETYGLDELASTGERLKLIAWMLGADVEEIREADMESIINDIDTYSANRFMGDPLHSRPVVVTYEENPDYDPNDNNSSPVKDTIFVTTNDGSFRAIDTSDGHEVFSFIPKDLLPNQNDYLTNDPDGIRRYGLDGPLTIWREESREDDNIDIDGTDHVYAYFGMRRGGNNIYALDVTDPDNPVLKWTIFGGDPDFADLGQTWSKPILAKVNWECTDLDDVETCTKKDVLFFGGGYDPVHDNADAATNGDAGAAIYMVDADNGNLLWSAGNNGISSDTHDISLPMQNSIPGDLTVADMNSDGTADIVIAADILGKVWRFDIKKTSSGASSFATGGEIADLAQSGQLRRFYNGPTVSLSQKRGRAPFFVITLGSGYMAHPREDDVSDRLYAIFEKSVYEPPKDNDGNIEYTSIDNGDLHDLDGTNEPADPDGNAPHGYYKDDFVAGEKFLRPSLTLFGITMYASYVPNQGNEPTCGLDHVGSGRLYAMDFVTGENLYQTKFIDLKHPGIPPEPVVLFIEKEENGKKTIEPVACVGTECFGKQDDANPWDEVTTQVLYWKENAK